MKRLSVSASVCLAAASVALLALSACVRRNAAVSPPPPPGAASARPALATADPATLAWTRHGVVLDRGRRGSYDDKNLESPIVVRQPGGGYVMFYRGKSSVDPIGRIMRAVSRDGLRWEKTGVVMEPAASYEGHKIDPMAVLFEDGEYRMWYGCAARGGAACHATSPDGIRWTRHPGNPVLRKTAKDWDNRGAGGQHTVVRADAGYRMIYKGYGSAAPGWTFYGLADSADGIHWTKQGKAVRPEPRLGETTVFKNLFAFRAGGGYYLAHTMADHLNLFLLHSADGRRWSKCGPMFSKARTPGDWDLKWATSPYLAVEGDRVRMWYEGGGPKGRVRVLYAETDADAFFDLCS